MGTCRNPVIAALAIVVFAISPASAQAPKPLDTKGTFSLVIENDRFTGQDRHYTNGIQASWLSGEDVPDWIDRLGDAMPVFADDSRRRYGVEIGHLIFTPENTATTAPIPNDRPYAAWLYGGFGLTAATEDRLDRLVLTLGIVGPDAGGEFVQNEFHGLIGVDEAMGWDNQIRNEPTLNLFYERQWRWLAESTDGFGFDAQPHLGVALGNVYTYAAAGLAFRFGRDLPADWGPPRVRPGLPGSAYFQPRSGSGFGWYLFAGAEGRAVARDIFLDGNTWKDSPSVDKKPLVADLNAGLAITFDAVRLAYTFVYRTKEFDGQDEADKFASISVSFRW
ncbi:MAG TPA: lipid A deacylase LpxR family protein [Alphaproteobacteria bacterium]